MVPGPQECHNKVSYNQSVPWVTRSTRITPDNVPQVSVSVIDQPEEHCDLAPHNVCRHKTTLVPRLRPEPECVLVPQQVRHCHQ